MMNRYVLVFALGLLALDRGAAHEDGGQGVCTQDQCPSCTMCKRNEIYVDGACVCPDSQKKCGKVTPFHNEVIVAACLISTVAILLHVAHDVFYTATTPPPPPAAAKKAPPPRATSRPLGLTAFRYSRVPSSR